MRTGVQEPQNPIEKEHEIPPIGLQDAGPNIYSGDEQQLEAVQAIYGPVLTFMKLGGIYFGETFSQRLGHLSTTGSTTKISIARIYCTAMVACHWFSFAMSIVSLCVEGSSVPQNFYTLITFGMWYFVSAIVATTCLVVLPLNEGKKSRFENFFHNLIERRVDLATLKLYCRNNFSYFYFSYINVNFKPLSSLSIDAQFVYCIL